MANQFYMTLVTVLVGMGLQAQAQSRCERVREVRGCVGSFADIDREQKKMDELDKSIQLRKSIQGVFKDINGKDLVMSYFGRHQLRIDYNSKNVAVTYNGEKTSDVKLCYEACPTEGKVTWFHDKHGEFKRIRDGLSVGGYEFKIDGK